MSNFSICDQVADVADGRRTAALQPYAEAKSLSVGDFYQLLGFSQAVG
ncbi:MAG: hypothetical protein M0Q49_00450 [Porticoccaceae bacterium]|nr:hypothetical protein [Porticoccaceae bacterium]